MQKVLGSGWERVKERVQAFEEVEEVQVEDKDLCVEVEVEEQMGEQ